MAPNNQNNVDSILAKIRREEDPFNKARLIKLLVKDKQMKSLTVAKQLGIKPSYLSHFLRLNRLPIIITDGYYAKLISLSHLFSLSRIKDREKIINAYEQVLTKNLSVKETDDLVRETIYELKPSGTRLEAEEKKTFLEKINRITPLLKAKIIQTRIKSKLILELKGDLKTTTPVLKDILARLVKKSST